MTHLYELSQAYKQLQDTEELTDDELMVCLNNIKEIFTQKSLNIGRLILSMQGDFEAIDTELERLNQRKQAVVNRVNHLKNYLAQEMQAVDIPKIKDEVLTISLVNNPPSVQIDNEAIIPTIYWRVIPETKTVDKKGILETYKENHTPISGITIITDKKHIMIR